VSIIKKISIRHLILLLCTLCFYVVSCSGELLFGARIFGLSGFSEGGEIPVHGSLYLNFLEAVDESTVTGERLFLQKIGRYDGSLYSENDPELQIAYKEFGPGECVRENPIPITITTEDSIVFTIKPETLLSFSTMYEVCVMGGIRYLLDGSEVTNFRYLFWTEGGRGPTVLALSPADGATNASIKTDVSVKINRYMNPDTIHSESFILAPDGGDPIEEGEISYSASTKRAICNPRFNLLPHTTYFATLTGEAEDEFENPIEEISWSFTTGAIAWAKTYGSDLGDTDRGRAVLVNSDDTFTVVGSGDQIGSGGRDILVLTLDQEGSLISQAAFGGAGHEDGFSVNPTSDGGYVVGSTTSSYGEGSSSILLMKFDSSDQLVMQKVYGTDGQDNVADIFQTSDGGYLIVGESIPAGKGVSYDYWLIKLDLNLEIEWEKKYGGSDMDAVRQGIQTSDGGYLIVGLSQTYGAGTGSSWIVKLNSDGTIVWEKAYGGAGLDTGLSIQETSDNHYITSGGSISSGAGGYDGWAMELGTSGSLVWHWVYGGEDDEILTAIKQTSDGGYIAGGYTKSFGAGDYDVWILKLDSKGLIDWERTYGGEDPDYLWEIGEVDSGGYILVGETSSYGAGGSDLWVMKTDLEGNIGNSCDLIGESDAEYEKPSEHSIVNSNTTVTDTSGNVTDVSVTVTSTDVDTATQCSY